MDLYVLNWAAMQAVSAIEARHRWPGAAILVAEPRVRELGVVEHATWQQTHWLDIRTRAARLERLVHWQRFRREVDRIVGGAGPIDRVFVGHLGAPMCHVIAASRAREVVVLDAGLLTPAIATARRRRQRTRDRVRERAAIGARRLLGLKTAPPKRVTFFSAYDLDVRAPDAVVHHRYEQLRAQRTERDDVTETWFIGQNFVEGGMITADRYEAFIAHAITGHDGVRYIAHPREEPARLDVLRRRFGFEITRFTNPLEIELTQRSWPRAILGVSSAALHSAALIAGGHIVVRAVRARDADLLRFNAGMNDVYNQLASVGVEIVEGPA